MAPRNIFVFRGPYRPRGEGVTDKELIQTKDSYRRCVIPTDKGPLQTIWALQTRGPYRKGALTDKEQLQTRGPYRPGAPTDQGPLQTRDPYRRCAISTDKGPLQTKDPYINVPYR